MHTHTLRMRMKTELLKSSWSITGLLRWLIYNWGDGATKSLVSVRNTNFTHSKVKTLLNLYVLLDYILMINRDYYSLYNYNLTQEKAQKMSKIILFWKALTVFLKIRTFNFTSLCLLAIFFLHFSTLSDCVIFRFSFWYQQTDNTEKSDNLVLPWRHWRQTGEIIVLVNNKKPWSVKFCFCYQQLLVLLKEAHQRGLFNWF